MATTASARADFAAGVAAYEAGDDAAAMRAWAPLAEIGDARAQFALGSLYESGRGVAAIDLDQAVAWYRAAATQRLPAAQNNLALLYAGGRGVPRNPFTAADLWNKAAAAGDPLAQFNLALAYERGFGLPRDFDAAARWYAEAGNRGVADAAFAISELYRTGRGVPLHDELAGLWLEVARKFGGSLRLREDFIASIPGGKRETPPSPVAAAAAEPATAAPAEAAVATPAEATVAPPAESAAATATTTPAADPVGTFAVQLASLASEAEASQIGAIIKSKHAELLGGFDLLVRRADLGAEKGVWYRVLAGPFARRDAATQLCTRLRAAPKPADCLVVSIK